MADERDPQVSRRYRELGSEEPPPALDQAILAASRQAVASRRRWYVPLAAAAVALLAVGVALHVQREQPDPETMTAPSEVKEEAPQRLRKQEAPRELRSEERPVPAPEAKRAPPMQDRQPAPAAVPPIPQTAPAPQPKLEEAQPQAMERMLGRAVQESPDKWLERIAELRRLERHDQADKALAEFRQRYPGYRIPQETLERIEKK
jgi:hypothetical protein